MRFHSQRIECQRVRLTGAFIPQTALNAIPLGGIALYDRVSRTHMCRIRTEACHSSPKLLAWSSAPTCPRGLNFCNAEHWRACLGWLQSCCARCGQPSSAARLSVPTLIALSPLYGLYTQL